MYIHVESFEAMFRNEFLLATCRHGSTRLGRGGIGRDIVAIVAALLSLFSFLILTLVL